MYEYRSSYWHRLDPIYKIDDTSRFVPLKQEPAAPSERTKVRPVGAPPDATHLGKSGCYYKAADTGVFALRWDPAHTSPSWAVSAIRSALLGTKSTIWRLVDAPAPVKAPSPADEATHRWRSEQEGWLYKRGPNGEVMEYHPKRTEWTRVTSLRFDDELRAGYLIPLTR